MGGAPKMVPLVLTHSHLGSEATWLGLKSKVKGEKVHGGKSSGLCELLRGNVQTRCPASLGVSFNRLSFVLNPIICYYVFISQAVICLVLLLASRLGMLGTSLNRSESKSIPTPFGPVVGNPKKAVPTSFQTESWPWVCPGSGNSWEGWE